MSAAKRYEGPAFTFLGRGLVRGIRFRQGQDGLFGRYWVITTPTSLRKAHRTALWFMTGRRVR